jgi:hypothetical protein
MLPHDNGRSALGIGLELQNKRGDRQEKVFDAVWSGDRQPGSDGSLPPVGNTVDVANATWSNTIGASELIGAWTDPEFDPQSARPATLVFWKFRPRAGPLMRPSVSVSR